MSERAVDWSLRQALGAEAKLVLVVLAHRAGDTGAGRLRRQDLNLLVGNAGALAGDAGFWAALGLDLKQTLADEIEYQFPPDASLPAAVAEDEAFTEWWVLYPRKVGRLAALKAWAAIRKRGSPPEQLIAGLRRSREIWKARGQPIDRIPHPTTWLNQGRWNDEEPPAATKAPDINGYVGR